ncbi:glycosyl transferase [Algibacter marinivivus]|uniref:Glycosyl transferase n=1 Tax=Algibacter marinivivus TaxID=2100723 RepID=A0A2U2X4T7_9FLAO|nr:glycosyltransferase family 4 protein [Algibacter marinivivus]PWH82791.1 glycosyl transferase [Algibacter marinivivus]
MRFLILTHVAHKFKDDEISAYAPYVREMNIWLKHVDEVLLIAPKSTRSKTVIDLPYNHDNLIFNEIPSIEFTNIKKLIFSIIKLPIILIKIFSACKKADHIHLRCPGNIGLLGSIVQIFFPKKIKTAKYAGNWDPEAVQPVSYKFQKRILSNTFLTKNMTALVYGDWENQTKNIKPFFTASYANEEREIRAHRDYSGKLKFVFVGGLVEGKRPLFAIQIIEKLNELGYNVSLDLYGDGILKKALKAYINEKTLQNKIKLLGNQSKETIKGALKEAHFLILASKSEGWPKAIAEAMFFGVIPISTSISCVPYMLDYGKRGVLIDFELQNAVEAVKRCLVDPELLKTMSEEAFVWSQKYTLDKFESEIVKLL